jgi:uncharacterized membrane protein YcaP (DUF421 family)
MSLLAARSSTVEKLLDDVPLILVDDGKLLKERMLKERVTEDDIMERARELRGIERLDQIKYAIMERNGHITIVVKPGQGVG